jgi:hypothetical protein
VPVRIDAEEYGVPVPEEMQCSKDSPRSASAMRARFGVVSRS